MQVNSEFQAFKHIDIRSRGEMARATKSLEATLALQPTLILTNSLPCSLDVIVWQASCTHGIQKLTLLLPMSDEACAVSCILSPIQQLPDRLGECEGCGKCGSAGCLPCVPDV